MCIRDSYYTIERSVDGNEWSEVGIIDGEGNTSTQMTYKWIDISPTNGVNYYRLSVAKKLVTHYMSMDALLKTNQEELESVDEIGDKIAVSVLEFIQNENNIILINRLKEYGLNMEVSRKELEQSSNLLQGKKIVVSGKFNVHSRDEIKQIITLNGGQIVSSVSAQTNLIVAGDNMGPSKLAKAKSLDIEILTEPEFLTQLGLDQNSSTENSTGQVSLF